MKHEENHQEWHNTTSKDKRERIALRNARWRMLELLKIEHVLNTMFILEYRLADHNFEKKLEEQLENDWSLDEPPCRVSMKNSGNKRMIERKGSWKHKVKPCDDLDGASRRDNAENLELQKRKDEASRTKNVTDEQLWKEKTRSLGWNNNKNYVMCILHQFKLMRSNRFGILLILVERIEERYCSTWEGLDGTTDGI